MDAFQRYLPSITIFGIAASICHVVGLYRYAGESWLSVLSVTDIVAQTWPVIPLLAIGVTGAVCFRALAGTGRPYAEVIEEQYRSPKRAVRLWANVKSLTLYFIGIAAVLLFLPLVWLLEPKDALFATMIAIIAGTALIFSVSEVPEVERRATARIAGLAYLFLAVSYSLGLARGASPFLMHQDDIVVTSTEERCVSIISVMNNGVLFTPDLVTVEFIEWDSIERVAQGTRCVVERPDA